MLEGMYAAASGMAAQQQQLDSIGNDLANLSTTGYKAQRTGFRDLLYNQVNIAGTATTTGAGAAAETVGRDQSQGTVRSTGNPLDLAIEGPGFFTVKRSNGETALTRDGAFQVDAQGRLTTAEGDLLDPPVTLPPGTSPGEVAIGPDGTVRAGTRTIGKIALVTVASPDRLLADGGNLFTPTATSGAPRPQASATIHQGALEGSNVDVGSEMVKMMSAQRSYQLESSAIQTENQMLSIANQLRS
ncbi:MAG TPA: flagellar hook-basal body protein [Solirubrobacteraceae bacterium]|jgi:flagellar basal-body rod protein FlgG|nr:flagellar hook-basal body protein [Solirubrobacteraceae bacterium]